jgi:hypothetical protein
MLRAETQIGVSALGDSVTIAEWSPRWWGMVQKFKAREN